MILKFGIAYCYCVVVVVEWVRELNLDDSNLQINRFEYPADSELEVRERPLNPSIAVST